MTSQLTSTDAPTTDATEPAAPRRLPRALARTGILGTLLIALFLAFAPAASAASWGYGGYNSWNWFGCQIHAGAVYDPASSNGVYNVYGGGQFANCTVRHNYRVYVQEQYSPNGSTWYNIGSQVHSPEYLNAYGMTANNITVTGPACGRVYWRTAVQVWADGYWSGWVYSAGRYAAATRC